MAVSCRSTVHKKDSKWSWLVCMCATICNALHMGIANSFAVMMPVLLEEFNESKERAGWLGSICVTLTFLPTPLAGMVCGRFGCRITSLIGAVICAAGLVLTSYANGLLMMYFTYSLMFGLGACFIHTGCVFAVTMYFDKRRSLATGIVGSAQSVGIITLAPALQELLATLGWRAAYRILAALFGLVIIAALTFDQNIENETSTDNGEHDNEGQKEKRKVQKAKFTCEMFKRPAYIFAVVCVTLGCFGALVTFIHLIKYCEEMGIAAQDAANLFVYIGASSLVSSVISGRVLDFNGVSPFHVNQFANTVLACSLLLLPQAHTYNHFVIFVVFFGLGFGCFITTIYLLLLNTVEPRLQFYSFPVGETIISAGTLGGAPLAGFIADVTGSYVPAFYTFGAVLLFAALLSFPVYFFGLHKAPHSDPNTDGLNEVEINLEAKKEMQENGEIGKVNEVFEIEGEIHDKAMEKEGEISTITVHGSETSEESAENGAKLNGYDNCSFVENSETAEVLQDQKENLDLVNHVTDDENKTASTDMRNGEQIDDSLEEDVITKF